VVSTISSQQESSWFEFQLGPFCVEFACFLRVCVGSLWVLRLPGYVSLCGPVMDWRPVQGVPRLSACDSWIGSKPKDKESQTLPLSIVSSSSRSNERL